MFRATIYMCQNSEKQLWMRNQRQDWIEKHNNNNEKNERVKCAVTMDRNPL